MSQNQITRRSVLTRTPFFLPVSVPFTSTVNETQTALFTKPALSPGNRSGAAGDLEIIGMTTDLQNVTGQFSINSKPIWSTTRVPLATLFGVPDGPKPVRWLEEPLTLLQGNRIKCDLLNVGGVPAGTLVFVARIKGDPGQRYEVADGIGVDDVLTIDSAFTGSAADDNRVASAKNDTEDFLIYGLHTNLQTATVRIKGVGGSDWMEDPVPLWAIAGRNTSEHAVQRLKDPYVIPAGYSLLVEFINNGAETSGQLFVKGKAIPALRR